MGCSKYSTSSRFNPRPFRLFLIYINDLLAGLLSNPRLFAGDISLFSVVRDMTSSANVLNDLLKIKGTAMQII